MPKLLITGSSGMLGGYVIRRLEKENYDIIAPSRAELDLIQPKNVYDFISNAMPDFILHLGAETDVDLCERNPRLAGIVNHLTTRAVALAARDTKAYMVYISTSTVFGGAEVKPLYYELDIPSPINYYGKSKLFGEREIENIYPDNSFIIRAGWMVGGGPSHDHKFVGKIIKQINSGAERLRVVSDKYGTITLASNLADFIILSLKSHRVGLVHYASSGIVSRFDIAKELADLTSYKGEIDPVSSKEFLLSAPRPVFDGISSLYIDSNASNAPGFWRDDLRVYMKEFTI